MSLSRNQKGLSLLELLVVFVIISMVTTTLVQGFGLGLSLYERVKTKSQQSGVETLSRVWFRAVNNSLVARKEPGRSLRGDRESYSAMTLDPLLGLTGFPTEITWRIVDDELHYIEGEQMLRILRVPEDARWEYLAQSGSWVDRWPMIADSDSLPRAVRLVSDEFQLTAAMASRLKPNLLLEESRRDRE